MDQKDTADQEARAKEKATVTAKEAAVDQKDTADQEARAREKATVTAKEAAADQKDTADQEARAREKATAIVAAVNRKAKPSQLLFGQGHVLTQGLIVPNRAQILVQPILIAQNLQLIMFPQFQHQNLNIQLPGTNYQWSTLRNLKASNQLHQKIKDTAFTHLLFPPKPSSLLW